MVTDCLFLQIAKPKQDFLNWFPTRIIEIICMVTISSFIYQTVSYDNNGNCITIYKYIRYIVQKKNYIQFFQKENKIKLFGWDSKCFSSKQKMLIDIMLLTSKTIQRTQNSI